MMKRKSGNVRMRSGRRKDGRRAATWSIGNEPEANSPRRPEGRAVLLSDVHRILAAVNLMRGDHEQASYHQSRALQLDPNDDLIVVQQGYL
jgi:hypothetical protein